MHYEGILLGIYLDSCYSLSIKLECKWHCVCDDILRPNNVFNPIKVVRNICVEGWKMSVAAQSERGDTMNVVKIID